MRTVIRWCLTIGLALGARAAVADDRPNVIVILADDLGYGDVGCYGAQGIATPRIDELARNGLRLTSFYAQPICGPSRAALMTGTYPVRIAEPRNRKEGHTQLHAREVTLAERLRTAGYRTGLVGKWHLGMQPGSRPLEQGFETAWFTPAFNGATKEIRPNSRVPIFRDDQQLVKNVVSQADMDQLTADSTREALAFVRKHRAEAFFLYLAYHMPHVPLGVSTAFRGSSGRGLYGDAVQELDHAVGQLLDELSALGLTERTIVFLTSDNGPWIDEQIGDHGGSAGTLRGGKMMTWEGGWRVPGIVSWPGQVPKGRESAEIVSTLDLLPTILAFTRVTTTGLDCDGFDLADFFRDPSLPCPRKEFAFHNGALLAAVRVGDFKLVRPRPAGGGIPWAPQFVTSHLEAIDRPLLFDVRTDPGEKTDLAAARPDVVELISKRARELEEDLGSATGPGRRTRFFDDGPRWPTPVLKGAK